MVHGEPREHRIGHAAPGSVERRVFVASVVPKGDVIEIQTYKEPREITCDICRILEVCVWCEETLDVS